MGAGRMRPGVGRRRSTCAAASAARSTELLRSSLTLSAHLAAAQAGEQALAAWHWHCRSRRPPPAPPAAAPRAGRRCFSGAGPGPGCCSAGRRNARPGPAAQGAGCPAVLAKSKFDGVGGRPLPPAAGPSTARRAQPGPCKRLARAADTPALRTVMAAGCFAGGGGAAGRGRAAGVQAGRLECGSARVAALKAAPASVHVSQQASCASIKGAARRRLGAALGGAAARWGGGGQGRCRLGGEGRAAAGGAAPAPGTQAAAGGRRGRAVGQSRGWS